MSLYLLAWFEQVFVANHTSMIDFIILEQMTAFAVIMQKHPGWVGKRYGLYSFPRLFIVMPILKVFLPKLPRKLESLSSTKFYTCLYH